MDCCIAQRREGEDPHPLGELPELCVGLGPFELKPRTFLVAWSGVLALAYDGWPAEVEALKSRLAERLGVNPENPGSLWPKTSLAALHDGKKLSPEDVAALQEACKAATKKLKKATWAPVVPELHVTTFVCRSHERLLCSAVLPLIGQPSGPASKASRENVDKIIAECESDGYWLQAAREGSRASHYRDGVLGTSLVAFVHGEPPGLAELRQEVDKALPGYYAWFKPDSLHCTIRGIIS
mmetsp:Transcript_130084/g.324292  ORF Transcript_130084/g.324292 Transcript_130084/m.324292 type:complete len:239 (+) Transcript_130084:35-751(+)